MPHVYLRNHKIFSPLAPFVPSSRPNRRPLWHRTLYRWLICRKLMGRRTTCHSLWLTGQCLTVTTILPTMGEGKISFRGDDNAALADNEGEWRDSVQFVHSNSQKKNNVSRTTKTTQPVIPNTLQAPKLAGLDILQGTTYTEKYTVAHVSKTITLRRNEDIYVLISNVKNFSDDLLTIEHAGISCSAHHPSLPLKIYIVFHSVDKLVEPVMPRERPCYQPTLSDQPEPGGGWVGWPSSDPTTQKLQNFSLPISTQMLSVWTVGPRLQGLQGQISKDVGCVPVLTTL